MKTTQAAGNLYEVDEAAVKRLNAFMATAPRRLRPLLSDEKMTVVGDGSGRKKRPQRKKQDAHSNQPVS
jgi:hypothetical protein